MKTHKHDVIIAGAGPVGLTAALGLKRRGLRPFVIESKSRGVTHSYALALHPASLSLLASLGVLDEIVAHAVLVRNISVYSGGHRIATVPVAEADHSHPFLAVLGQDGIESVLASAIEGDHMEISWNHRLARFEQDTDSVLADVDELEERVFGYAAARFDWVVKRGHRIEAKYMIGADGHGSLVRRQLEIGFPEARPAEHYAVFEFQVDGSIENEVALVLHEDGIGVLWPLPDGRARWSFAVNPTRYPEAFREKDHDPVQVVGPGAYPALEENFFKSLLQTRAPWFDVPIGHLYWRMLVRFERRLADSFGNGRIWLAGDSAHLTAPAGIQSMNVGMQEAHNLAEAIALGIEQNDTDIVGNCGRRAHENWEMLLGMKGSVEAAEGAHEEIAKYKDSIISCLPASGKALESLAERLGLKMGVSTGV